MRYRNGFIVTVMVLVLLLLALPACSGSSSPSPTPTPNEVSLGQEFTLSIGQAVAIAGEDLEIKFVEVVSDSRCPQGVTCIWAGEVSCLVEVSKGNAGTYRIVLTQSGSNSQTFKQIIDGYYVMFRVEPYPVAGKQIDENEYRLVMTVTKSSQSNVDIRPAPIHEVKVSIAKSNPPQIIVYIKGGLSDGCTTFNELETNRAGTTVTISVTTRHPKDTVCPAIYGFFEQTVNLGSDFIRGEIYTLQVNDYITTFQYPI